MSALVALLSILAGCSEKSPDEAPMVEEPMATAAPASMMRSAAPADASVFFVTPADGSTVSNPVHIEFGTVGMSIVAAGVSEANSGHHHLLIDTPLPDLGMPIPKDEQHVHFGDASTATDLELAPGTHTLQLLLGDHLHVPHNPPIMSEVITITVE